MCKNSKWAYLVSSMEHATPDDFSDEKHLHRFCKEAACSFFDQFGLISHQINSYNEFVDNGIQRIVDSIGAVDVDPEYDPSKKRGHGWRHARVTFGKVKLGEPTMWTDRQDTGEEALKLSPKHSRLQNMTYACKMTVKVNVQVYTEELLKSDKSKTGKEQYNSNSLHDVTRKIVIGSIPVMVKSKLCRLHQLKKSDCPFDIGGYFIIKGMEKFSVSKKLFYRVGVGNGALDRCSSGRRKVQPQQPVEEEEDLLSSSFSCLNPSASQPSSSDV
ncbi:hypothetical protein Taro_012586 [Colocasia esculenta]|uniref:DNA-directed RNA polymerase n=1 Tax=Colocasia esculenta TaxID=4460 RepID=A0A843UDD9_COLES|nr:hypothetical protein [Colocasia esculenta]